MDHKADIISSPVTNTEDCSYKAGPLPACHPLASAIIPPQTDASPRYKPEEALTRGTLFPGLDLPLMNTVNKSNPYAGTPLGELMALQFMEKELQLYLDTHSEDKDAFSLLREVINMRMEAQKRFAARFGPICFSDLEDMDSYRWICDPWPWSFDQKGDNA